MRAFQSGNSSLWSGVHWLAKGVLRKQGYRWEVRRSGDLRLGYFRKALRIKDPRSPYPKRLVILPGLGDTPLSWIGIVTATQRTLKKNFDEVLLFDFPGFGGVLRNEKAFPSVALLTTGLADVLDSLKPHTLIGHSLGGWLAGYYAGLCGDEKRPLSNRLNFSGPKGLVVLNPLGIGPDQGIRDQLEAALTTSFASLRPHLFAHEPRWFKTVIPQCKELLKREDVTLFLRSAGDEFKDLSSIVQKIQAKGWVVWGELDTLSPPVCSMAWLKNMKDACGVFVKDVGHSLHLETPVVTAIVLNQILSGKVPHRKGSRWWEIVDKRDRLA